MTIERIIELMVEKGLTKLNVEIKNPNNDEIIRVKVSILELEENGKIVWKEGEQ